MYKRKPRQLDFLPSNLISIALFKLAPSESHIVSTSINTVCSALSLGCLGLQLGEIYIRTNIDALFYFWRRLHIGTIAHMKVESRREALTYLVVHCSCNKGTSSGLRRGRFVFRLDILHPQTPYSQLHLPALPSWLPSRNCKYLYMPLHIDSWSLHYSDSSWVVLPPRLIKKKNNTSARSQS